MANAEQLALLKAGIEGWNTWRGMNPEQKIDLTVADLRGADLSEANLSGANLQGANLIGADLRGASVLKANLSANFSKADLRGAGFFSVPSLKEARMETGR